jgi:leucyl aminopeptidase
MQFDLEGEDWLQGKHDFLAIAFFEGEPASAAAREARLERAAARLFESGDFAGEANELAILYAPEGGPASRVALLGLGKREKADLESLRRAVGAAVKKARALRAGTMTVLLPAELRALAGSGAPAGLPERLADAKAARAVFDAALLASYEYERYMSKRDEEKRKRPGPADIDAVRLVAPGASREGLEDAVRVARALERGVRTCRDLGNLPGNDGTPRVLADRARAIAAETGLRCEVLERGDMERLGMGALLGVAQGSEEPPKLIVLEHTPPGTAGDPIVLVGKGVTFDSGGISIKPAESMEEMKFDKCGGCAVIGAMEAIARLDLPQHVVGLVPAVENLPSGAAQKPGDIRRAMDGQTIEIINTDAEGRLILADALAYAVTRWRPRAIVDLATLTGACVVALGGVHAGLFANDERLAGELRCAGAGTGERVWPMPLDDDYDEKIKSAVADVKNSGGRPGGAVTAARFLKKFVKDAPWAHLDIAGTAWTTEERPYHMKGATGFGVRLLIDWLRARSAEAGAK